MISLSFAAVENPVAFSVALDGAYAPSADEKIPYNDIITNVGNGYITERREFVCPHAGLYVFYAAGYAVNGASCWLEIMKNDILVGRLWFTQTTYAMGSNMFVLELVGADNVAVKSVESGCHLWGGDVVNTFSGFRIN